MCVRRGQSPAIWVHRPDGGHNRQTLKLLIFFIYFENKNKHNPSAGHNACKAPNETEHKPETGTFKF